MPVFKSDPEESPVDVELESLVKLESLEEFESYVEFYKLLDESVELLLESVLFYIIFVLLLADVSVELLPSCESYNFLP